MTMSNVQSPSFPAIFAEGRTHSAFRDEPISDTLLRTVWDIARMGPTAMNMGSLRVLFVRSKEGKERLRPTLSAGNVDKTMSAPVTAIFAFDVDFHEHLPKLFPHAAGARERFAAQTEEERAPGARMNATLGAGYFILAARAQGLDCGPMGGFDAKKVDAEFFAGTSWRALFLCNLGYGVPEKLHPRAPRLDFDEACKVG